MSLRILALVALVSLPAVALAAPVHHTETLSASTVVGSGRVNINTASLTELMTLDGVGRKLAEKIVEHRQTHGPFRKPEDLRRVEGVGAALWEKNRARITVK
jgi:competence protein ComEA